MVTMIMSRNDAGEGYGDNGEREVIIVVVKVRVIEVVEFMVITLRIIASLKVGNSMVMIMVVVVVLAKVFLISSLMMNDDFSYDAS